MIVACSLNDLFNFQKMNFFELEQLISQIYSRIMILMYLNKFSNIYLLVYLVKMAHTHFPGKKSLIKKNFQEKYFIGKFCYLLAVANEKFNLK